MSRFVLVGLLLVVLVMPLAVQAGGPAAQRPYDGTELSLTPRASAASYVTSRAAVEAASNRLAPLALRMAQGGAAAVAMAPVWFTIPAAMLPAGHRRIYLLPAFNTKYK